MSSCSKAFLVNIYTKICAKGFQTVTLGKELVLHYDKP